MAKERDQQSQGFQRPLLGPGGLMTTGQFSVPYGMAASYSPGIIRGDGADWFGPLNPMAPTAPEEVIGRQLDFPSGYNLNITPRAYEQIGFSELRSLADSYDILRLVIETRKDQMEKLKWTIRPKIMANGVATTKADDPVIQELTDFFERPDGRNDWGAWLRSLLEDLFVIDAPTLYRHETKGGKLIGLEQIDGATIKRVIDDWGRTPQAPVPAYQQILKGLPAVNYTDDQMIYLPRNLRVHKVYGFSPVEQIIMTINIALRREMFQLQYYTEGNIPEALVGTPDLWNPQQIGDFQKAFDAMLAGNQANRRRIKFVPGGVAKTFVPTKEVELTGQTDEWLASVVCFCFSISAQAFKKQMNRATAETAQEAALEEGLAPVMAWVARLVNYVIRCYWPNSKVEFAWDDMIELDQKVQMDVNTGYVKAGIKTIDEVRDKLGEDPLPNGVGAVPRFATATGYMNLNANDDAPTAGERAQTQQDNADAAAEATAQALATAPQGQATPAVGSKPAAKPAKGGDTEKVSSNFLKRLDFWERSQEHEH